MKDKVTVELTQLEAEKVMACIGYIAKNFEIEWIKNPNNYDVKERMDYYSNLADKFNYRKLS